MSFHCLESETPRAVSCCTSCVPIPTSRVIFHDSVQRGRWLKDVDGVRYGVMPAPVPGRAFVLGGSS